MIKINVQTSMYNYLCIFDLGRILYILKRIYDGIVVNSKYI